MFGASAALVKLLFTFKQLLSMWSYFAQRKDYTVLFFFKVEVLWEEHKIFAKFLP